MIGRAARAPAAPARLAACLCLFGCAAPPPGRHQDLALDLLRRTPEAQVERYRVDAAGRLSFAGGDDALADRFTWSRALSEEELAALRRRLDEDGWRRDQPRGSGEPAGLRYEIGMQGGPRRGHAIQGVCPAAEALRDLLAGWARQRHDEFLQRLPRGGPPGP